MKSLSTWIRTLQRALALEVEKEFENFRGRREYFHEFISREIVDPPTCSLKEENVNKKLDDLAKAFIKYPGTDKPVRRHLVIKARKLLYEIGRNTDQSVQVSSPKLKFPDSSTKTIKNTFENKESIDLKSPLSSLKQIGIKSAEKLAGIGILSIKDFLEYFPRDYVDYSSLCRIASLEEGKTATIVATVRRCNSFTSPRNKNLSILELYLQDHTGKIKVTKFLAGRRFSNFSYLKSQANLYKPGVTIAVSGLVKKNPYGITFKEPLFEVMENSNSVIRSKSIGRIVPVYNLTEGISADRIRELINIILPLASFYPDPLSKEICDTFELLSKEKALIEIHRPTNQKTLKSAKRRLVFDEFLLLQLGLLLRRLELRKRRSPSFDLVGRRDGLVGNFLKSLPFLLTDAQKRVIAEIESDLVLPEPMARLLQGDVGSGKTVVATAALLNAVDSGWQGALMAPTEVLAEQHYRNLCRWLPPLHVTVDLITGSTSRLRRRQILDDLANGTLQILVGTHALIEDYVAFARLGLVVVDEQHRFGVRQRNRLLDKGLQPHLLTMTATPIPRTLALSVHGDLDVSQIDQLPPGRTPVQTKLISGAKRSEAYKLIREEVTSGQLAYIVLPLVEESEKLDLRSAVMVHAELSEEIFPDFSVGLLHGRLSSSEKQSVIRSFSEGEIQILVSTTVIEVGMDVPQASVMVIDHADRFGLAQLHQLRGRVGRGAKESYCLLINESSNDLSRHRLEIMTRSNDGFEISELDLRLRGPGQVLGTKQSGLPDFALASLCEDGKVIQEARDTAMEILRNDPSLTKNNLLKGLLQDQLDRQSMSSQLN